MPRAALFPTGFADEPRRDHDVRRRRRARVLRRAEPRVDHRRLPARARRRRRLPPQRPRPSRGRSLHATRRPPRARRQRHGVLDGRRPRRPRRARRAVRDAKARCSSSTRPTRCSAPSSTLPPTPTCCASARCRRRSARSAASSPGPTRYVELVENLARPYIFTTAPTPADTRPRPSPRCGCVRSPEGDALVARLRALVDRLRPGHPSPIVPFVFGDEETHAARVRRAARAAACSSPRSGRRRSRPERRGCASRCPPHTPTTRSTCSRTRSTRSAPSCRRPR